ncbi:hypothetical protein [Streptomyces gilvus]|uniref:hypothetical protein n=1 Tax=Streptomyces gilvus TaxID=2920937 RepID=UPI001F0E76B6|nr:hypothetical protein [Streptomyces sp. CME 23]MCH5675626.1 hypothetical protein [Streptomyces sp. CME 23]
MEALVTDMMAETDEAEVVSFAPRSDRRHLETLLEASEGGTLRTSLADLVALGSFRDAPAAQRAVAGLCPVDHVVSVDVGRVDTSTVFEIRWTPVSGIVNLMLDWDLTVLEITVAELAVWLEAGETVVEGSLARLSEFPGVEIDTKADASDNVRIALDVEYCPLTAALPAA